MSDLLTVSVIADEPDRFIVMGEARSVVFDRGSLRTNYAYYGQRNKGDWVALEPYGNRIPSDW